MGDSKDSPIGVSAAPRPLRRKKFDGVVPLYFLYLACYRRLTDAKATGGFTEAALEGYGEEGAGLRRGHRTELYLRS